jgi:hypothetical protein
MPRGLRQHVFIDEGKARGYLMVAAFVTPFELGDLRKVMRSHLLRGQRRIHFNHEGNPRRKLIINALTDTSVRCRVYQAVPGVRDIEARSSCMTSIARDTRSLDVELIVIERDDPAVSRDLEILRKVQTHPPTDSLIRYEHRRPHEECLLWIPDAVAWCWGRGGEWRKRVFSIIENVEEV